MDFNLQEILDTTYRAFISLVTLFLITKVIGKKQVSQLTLFDYVIGISIGNFAAEMTINLDSNEINGIIAVVIFGVIAYAVSYITMKSITIRKFFSGSPTILIQEGHIIKDNLMKVKFDMDDLLEVCRCNGYFDISEIEYALMEANGEISFLPKAEYKPVTMKDIKRKTIQDGLVANIIIDGKMMMKNLENMNKDEQWFYDKLEKMGYTDIEDILLATLDNKDKINIYLNDYNRKIKDVLD